MQLLIFVTQGLLGLLFFGLSATVEVGAFKSKFSEKRGLACGACCQFFVVPALGFAATQLFDLPVHYGVTLLVLCSSPGGSYSNWWCSMFNADLTLSVVSHFDSFSLLFSLIFSHISFIFHRSVAMTAT